MGYARFMSGGWYRLSFCGHRTRIDQLPASASLHAFCHTSLQVSSARSVSSEHRRSLCCFCGCERSSLREQHRTSLVQRALCLSSCRNRSSRSSGFYTHYAYPMVCLLCLDEGVDHLRARRSSSLAKNVAAFFKISRSSLRTFTSLRSLLSSWRSSVVSPSRSPASICA